MDAEQCYKLFYPQVWSISGCTFAKSFSILKHPQRQTGVRKKMQFRTMGSWNPSLKFLGMTGSIFSHLSR